MGIEKIDKEFGPQAERVSYHTFVFPFRWIPKEDQSEADGNKKAASDQSSRLDTRGEFARCLNDRFKMVDTTWLDWDGNDADGKWDQGYAVYQYFNNAAKRLITCDSSKAHGENGKMGSGDDVVWNYRFDPPKGEGKFSYYIRCIKKMESHCSKNGQDDCIKDENESCVKETEYFLPVRAIWVKLFDMGIGLLIFELEYWGHKRIKYPKCLSPRTEDSAQQKKDISFEDVSVINERGRRVFPPFLTPVANNSDEGNGLSADAAGFVWDRGEGESWDYFRDEDSSKANTTSENNTFSKIDLRKERKGSYEPLVPNFISYFLTGSYEGQVYTADVFDSDGKPDDRVKKSDGKTHFAIEPIIDDRMFTMCFLGDKSLFDRVKVYEEASGDYAYLTDPDVMEDLYALGFIDEHGGCSCKNRVMLKDMLQKHVYARWIDGDPGNINVSSEYSFMCLASAMPFFLTNPFLTQYQQMVYIALAQRASLLSLENRISQCASNTQDDEDDEDKRPKKSEPSMGAKVRELQRLHIYFSSRYLLPEVTSQQQGIELYDMLLDTMLVDKRSQQIDKQINDLFDLKNNEYDLAESKDDRIQNAALFIIALAGLISLTCDLTGSPVTDRCVFAMALLIIVFVLYVLIRLLRYGFMELIRSLMNRRD